MSTGARRALGPRAAAGGAAARTSTRPIAMWMGVFSVSACFAAADASARSVASVFAPTGSSVAAGLAPARAAGAAAGDAGAGRAAAGCVCEPGFTGDAAGLAAEPSADAPGFGALAAATVARGTTPRGAAGTATCATRGSFPSPPVEAEAGAEVVPPALAPGSADAARCAGVVEAALVLPTGVVRGCGSAVLAGPSARGAMLTCGRCTASRFGVSRADGAVAPAGRGAGCGDA